MVDAILSATLERLGARTEGESAEAAVSVHDVAARAGVGIGSLYDYFRDRDSLLAAAAAKLAQDNLDAFEALLATTEPMSLREAVESVLDFAFRTYGNDTAKLRVVVRVTTSLGLLPTLARSQSRFATSLASTLRRRKDVGVADIDQAAWLVTQALMGIMQTLIWTDEAVDRRAVHDSALEMFVGYLRGELEGEREPERPASAAS
jgi:AcrR family transcriptional regulator